MVTSKPRVVTLLALLLLGSIVLAASVIALGFYDPIPNYVPIWFKELNPMQLSSNTRDIRWLSEDLPQSPLSVRVTANYDSGDLDSSYGLLLGQENGNIAVMISPLGYVSIWQESASTDKKNEDFYLPWQTWPHVRTGDKGNEIFVTLDGEKISVRVNCEWLWEANKIDSVDRIGIIGESYGGDTSINFQLAEISAAETEN